MITNMMMRKHSISRSRTISCVSLLVISFSAFNLANAQTQSAARIVVIKPRAGMQREFEAGYKRHLEWHRQNKDTWTWYGWQIISGDRFGYFMDGTFDHNWTDFDRAVAPAEDAADNFLNVAPYGDFLSLSHYELVTAVNQGNLLERRTPSTFIELVHYQLHPGTEAAFENAIRQMESRQAAAKGAPRAWYKLVSGGPLPSYLLMIAVNKLSELGELGSDASLLRQVKASVKEMKSETLRYRSDLSYLP